MGGKPARAYLSTQRRCTKSGFLAVGSARRRAWAHARLTARPMGRAGVKPHPSLKAGRSSPAPRGPASIPEVRGPTLGAVKDPWPPPRPGLGAGPGGGAPPPLLRPCRGPDRGQAVRAGGGGGAPTAVIARSGAGSRARHPSRVRPRPRRSTEPHRPVPSAPGGEAAGGVPEATRPRPRWGAPAAPPGPRGDPQGSQRVPGGVAGARPGRGGRRGERPHRRRDASGGRGASGPFAPAWASLGGCASGRGRGASRPPRGEILEARRCGRGPPGCPARALAVPPGAVGARVGGRARAVDRGRRGGMEAREGHEGGNPGTSAPLGPGAP